MAKGVTIKLNSAGIRELLRSSEMGETCMEFAQRIQNTAGEHYTVEARSYPERTGAAVFPADDEGYYDNLHHNTLIKAMGAVKG